MLPYSVPGIKDTEIAEGQQEEDKNIIRPVRAIQLSDASVLVADIYPGRATATQEADLSFRVSGQLIKLKM